MVLGYDNFYAHPTSSYNEPVPVPDVEPDEGTLVQVCLSEAWLSYVLGALSQLQLQTTWQGDPDTVLRGQGMATNLKGLFANPACPADNVPTPFWDEDSEVDDELPDDAQPWYGTVSDPEAPQDELDFVENAAIFAITGFLAIATWEIGAAPAILFHTIAPKFVLAMRRGDAGEIIRILVDGQEAARVDTSASAPGDVIRVPVVANQELDGHDIAIVQVS